MSSADSYMNRELKRGWAMTGPQAEIIDHLKNGWELYWDRAEGGCQMQHTGSIFTVSALSVQALERHGIIRNVGGQFLRRYELVSSSDEGRCKAMSTAEVSRYLVVRTDEPAPGAVYGVIRYFRSQAGWAFVSHVPGRSGSRKYYETSALAIPAWLRGKGIELVPYRLTKVRSDE
jgi:hypothetical protein